jgi:hypothetical protein
MDLKTLSFPQRFAAGLGCVVVLGVGALAVLYAGLTLAADQSARRGLARAPAGWSDSLRRLARPLAMPDLVPSRTAPGDGADALWDTTLAWHGPNVEPAYRALLGAATPTDADSAAWHAVAGDTSLDRFVLLARRARWDGVDRALGRLDPAQPGNIFALPLPRYRGLRNAGYALVIRGLQRAGRGDLAAARADLAASTGIGEQLFRREATLAGVVVGRAMVLSGARGWEHLARMTGDTALVTRARLVQAWASGSAGRAAELLSLAPDSALAMAGDTTLTVGMRSEAMSDALLGWALRPRGFLFGPPGRVADGLARLEQDRDRDVARLATLAHRTAEGMRYGGVSALLRGAGAPR